MRITKSISLFRERYLHIVAGVICSLIAVAFSHYLFDYMRDKAWDYASLYSAIFDLSTVYSALLFGFVSYFRTIKQKFIDALPERLYWGAIDYAEDGFRLGMALIIVSIPFIVIQPSPESSFDVASFFFAMWLGLAVSAVLSFIRASKIFWLLMSATSAR